MPVTLVLWRYCVHGRKISCFRGGEDKNGLRSQETLVIKHPVITFKPTDTGEYNTGLVWNRRILKSAHQCSYFPFFWYSHATSFHAPIQAWD